MLMLQLLIVDSETDSLIPLIFLAIVNEIIGAEMWMGCDRHMDKLTIWI